MEKKALGISWLNGKVKAAAFSRGTITAEWVSSALYDENADLTKLFREAAAGTKFTGKHVFMVVAHRRLAHQLIETPPVRGLDLELFVERRAAQLKTFDDECVTSFHEALPTKTSNGIILHLFPKAFLTSLAQSAQEAGLQLTRLYPTVPILAEHLKQLPIEEDEAVVLTVETEGISTVVVGRKDGSLALARSLNTSWKTDPERIIGELNRSMLFVKQQSAIPVTRIWLFGEDAAEKAAAFSALTDVRVDASPVPLTDRYWIERAAPLPPRMPDNLLSRDFQRGAQRQIFFKLTVALVVLFTVLCIGVAVIVETLLHRENKSLAAFKAKEAELVAEGKDLERQLAAVKLKRELAQQTLTNAPVPIPLVFSTHLATTVPPQFTLTTVEVKGLPAGWAVLIKGRAPASGPGNLNPVQALEKLLADGPFKVSVTNSSRILQGRGLPDRRHPDVSGAGGFYIEGTLR